MKKYIQIVMITCGMAAVCLGLCMNIAGLFFTPVSEALNVGRGAVSLSSTLITFSIAITGLFVPKIINEHNLKRTIIISTLLSVITTVLLGLCNRLIVYYLLSIIRGISAGLLSLVLITNILNNWFVEKNGLVTGITMSFSGLTGALCSPLIGMVINNYGYRIAYFTVSIITLLFLLPSIIFKFTLKPESMGYKPYGINSNTDTQMLNNKPYRMNTVIIMCIIAFLTSGLSGCPQHFTGLSTELLNSASIGSMMLSIALIGNIVSKLIIGVLIDKYNGRTAYLIAMIINLMGCLIVVLTNNELLLYAGSFLFGFIYAAGTICLSQLTKEKCGMNNYVRVYPLVSFIATAGTAIFVSAMGYMYDYFSTYVISYYIAGGISFIIIIYMLLRRN
ncbi:MAG: MFS transporter [Erysipelotrichaceae bacterium]